MAEVLASAFLSASIDHLVSRLASSQILRFLKLNDDSLRNLEQKLNTISGLLTKVEEKQYASEAVKNWVDDVKEVVYDAEDFLADIDIEVQRLSDLEADISSSQTCFSQVCPRIFSSINSFDEEDMYNKKAKHILLRFEILEDALNILQPTTTTSDGSPVHSRGDDETHIMSMLLSDDARWRDLDVIPIVGMGGVGKTTLAMAVYRNIQRQKVFDLIAWVLVSDCFDVLEITKDILKQVGVLDCDYMTADQLHRELKEKLAGKKLLLILDDVWSEDGEAWSFFLSPLTSAAPGSKILVTTRSQRVAAITGTVPSYFLQEMSHDDALSLFAQHAFSAGDDNARLQSEEISPLEVVGDAEPQWSLLKSETDVEKWKKILKTADLRNDRILPALVSYLNLPSHLQKCLAYCAILPNGYLFEKEELILLWMAEGLLSHSDGNKKKDGFEYFQQLESMSFFKPSSAHSSSFVMDDNISKFSKLISGESSVSLSDGNSSLTSSNGSSSLTSSKTRWLSCPSTRYEEVMNDVEAGQVQKLRTFLSMPKERVRGGFKDKEIQVLLPRFKRLRVLSLSNIRELPDSIGNLQRLWYLNLSETSIKWLPDSVTLLFNLQMLILHQCRDLVELPNNMKKLINLHHVDIKETRLQQMPPEMGKLKKLCTLTDFFVGKQSGSNIKELGELKCLQGELRIWNLQNVDAQDASEANLKGMKNLKQLKLNWTGNTDDLQHKADILELLKPHLDLDVLAISGYRGTKLSNWISNCSFSNLADLRLSRCKHCYSLPSLGDLASLQSLMLEAFDGVEVVSSDFYGRSPIPFESLKSLTFERMPQWREWTFRAGRNESRAFPQLQVLCLRKCPELKRIDLPKFRDINTMKLYDDFHKVQLDKLPSDQLLSLTVDSFHPIDFIIEQIVRCNCSPTHVQKIDITRFPFKHFPLKLFPKLKQLEVHKSPYLESLCAEEVTLPDASSTSSLKVCEYPNLENLTLSNCSNLKSLHCFLPSLVNLKIAYCNKLESFPGVGLSSLPEVGLSSRLEKLEIHGCGELLTSSKQWDLRKLPCLSQFHINDCEELEFFPVEDMPLPSTLTSLRIYGVRSLEVLKYEGLQHLTVLEKLEIKDCPELQSMPEKGLPCSLASLTISGCPLLGQRCQRETGEDWHKIFHIPKISVEH